MHRDSDIDNNIRYTLTA